MLHLDSRSIHHIALCPFVATLLGLVTLYQESEPLISSAVTARLARSLVPPTVSEAFLRILLSSQLLHLRKGQCPSLVSSRVNLTLPTLPALASINQITTTATKKLPTLSVTVPNSASSTTIAAVHHTLPKHPHSFLATRPA